MAKTPPFDPPKDWSAAESALFVVLTDWIGAVLGRAWHARNIDPAPELIDEINSLMVHHVAFLVEATRETLPAPREPRALVEQFCRHVLVEYFGTPEDRRREFRIVN